MAVRFHLDEHISPIVAEILRQYAIGVTTTQDVGLLGESDESQLSFAGSQGRILVTCDAGFTHSNLVSRESFGICFCHRDKYTIHEFADALRIVAECMMPEEMHRCLEYL